MTKSISKIGILLVALYLLVAVLTFSVRHPWATDMEIFINAKSVLLFRRVSYENARPRQEYTHKCLGCGTDWISDKPVDDINTCPNCPISIEELDRIIEELEKQRKDGDA